MAQNHPTRHSPSEFVVANAMRQTLLHFLLNSRILSQNSSSIGKASKICGYFASLPDRKRCS
jgi:hypothetical protein